jgi:dipeptidyl aminopeptidase/acylaminoacyl peptidase
MKTFVATVVLAAMFGVGFGQGAQKRPMTFADLMAMKRVSDPQVSPSGKWVLFSVTEVSLEKNTKVNHLWVVPLGAEPMSQNRDMGHPAERQLTFGDGESNGRFSPDDKWVSISEKDQIYLAAWDEAKGSVGDAKALTTIAGGADGAIWSPDSKRLLLVASVYPECSARATWAEEDACDKAKDEAAEANPSKAQLFTHLLYRHWNAFTGERRSHVLVVNADGGGVRDLTPRSAVGDAEVPTFSLGGPLGYAWAPDSKEVAYVANLDAVPAASTNNDVFTLRLDEPGANAVKVSTSLGSDDGPQYSPDGKWLAFRSQKRAGYESDRFRLMRYHRLTKEAPQELLPKFDGWIDEFVYDSRSSGIVFVSSDHGEAHLNLLGLGREDLGAVTTYEVPGEFSEIQLNPGQTVVASRMLVDNPTQLVTVDLFDLDHGVGLAEGWGSRKDVKGKYAVIADLNRTKVEDLSLSPLESYSFTGAEGAKVQGFIVKPPNFDASKKYPVKFLIHGGPQGAWGDAWSYRWNAELMAADGYVVVMVNPRGSTGYGQAFIDGVNGDWGGKAYVDLMKGLDAAEAQFPFIDKTRECALGASYGGYMANWVLTHTNRFKCIVTHDGMYNPAAAYGDTEELWFNEWEFRRAGDAGPGQPWKYAALPAEQDPFRKWSPMLHIQDAKTPTLVIHSQRDYRLDVSEGFQLFTALQRLGVPSEMLYFPDEGHWVLKPKNSELWYKTVSDWCNKWTEQ